MDVRLNKLPKSKAELVIELSPEEMRPYLDQAAAQLSKSVNIPGFRPGKAPYKVVESEIGAMKIYQKAAELAVENTYPKAVIEQKLVTIGSPEISLEKIAPDNPFSYRAIVSLFPSVELGNYKNISILKKEVRVKQEDIEASLKQLQKMLGQEKKVDRPVQKGDKVEVDMKVFMDNVPIDGGSSKNQAVIVGEGHFISGFEDNLVGMSAGKTKEFSLKFPKEYHKKSLAGKQAEFRVKVNQVYEIELPALDDNFAKKVGGAKNIEELRGQIEKNIRHSQEAKERQRCELAVIDEIIKRSKFSELPQLLIDVELDKMLHELKHDVESQGMKYEDYLASIKKSSQDLRKDFLTNAEKRVKTALVLKMIAEQEKIDVNENELQAELDRNKQQYKDNKEILAQIDTNRYREYLKNALRSQKTIKFLLNISVK